MYNIYLLYFLLSILQCNPNSTFAVAQIQPTVTLSALSSSTWADHICLPDLSHKKAIAMLYVNQDKTHEPERTHILSTHTTKSLHHYQKKAHILHVGHFRFTSILCGPEETSSATSLPEVAHFCMPAGNAPHFKDVKTNVT